MASDLVALQAVFEFTVYVLPVSVIFVNALATSFAKK